MTKALYAGSFDPITYGHIDIIRQAYKLFNTIVVGIADNPDKKYLFTPDTRKEMVKTALNAIHDPMDMLIIDVYSGMTIDYAARHDVDVLIRGLRAISDFEAEFQMTLFNRKAIGENGVGLNTIFFIPQEDHVYLSSSAIKGIVRSGGNVEKFVPPIVYHNLQKVLTR